MTVEDNRFDLPAGKTERSGPCYSSSHLERLLACAFQFDGPLSGSIDATARHAESKVPSFQFRSVHVIDDTEASLEISGATCSIKEAREITSAKNSRSSRMPTVGNLAAGRIHFYPTRAVILEHQSGAKRIQRNGYIPLHNIEQTGAVTIVKTQAPRPSKADAQTQYVGILR